MSTSLPASVRPENWPNSLSPKTLPTCGIALHGEHSWRQKQPGLWPYYGQLCECGNVCFAHPAIKARFAVMPAPLHHKESK